MNKIILLFSTMILVFLAACDVDDDTIVSPPNDPNNDVVSDPDSDDYVGFAGITEKQCTDANGYWNTCGSPCAGTNADFCIEICQVQCECSGIAGFGCPEGFKCRLSGGIADELGVCVKE